MNRVLILMTSVVLYSLPKLTFLFPYNIKYKIINQWLLDLCAVKFINNDHRTKWSLLIMRTFLFGSRRNMISFMNEKRFPYFKFFTAIFLRINSYSGVFIRSLHTLQTFCTNRHYVEVVVGLQSKRSVCFELLRGKGWVWVECKILFLKEEESVKIIPIWWGELSCC